MQYRETDTVWRNGNNLNELPFSKMEVEEIADLFSENNLETKTFIYEQANEQSVKSNIDKLNKVAYQWTGVGLF